MATSCLKGINNSSFGMRKYSFLKNKYTLLLAILLLLLGVDAVLHKGMTRVLLPANFPDDIEVQKLTPISKNLKVTAKDWKKAVNSQEAMLALQNVIAGFEMDVYFDTARNNFFVYHDSTRLSTQTLEGLLEIYQQRGLNSSIWLDFKNLSEANEQQSLQHLLQLRQRFALQHKIIVESTSPEWLQSFIKNDFFTSYYTPFFNPYGIQQNELRIHVDNIAETLRKYNVSALSGYYFQLPALKKYFPSYPLLSWSDQDRFSLISFFFHQKIMNDPAVKVLLYP